MATISTLLDIGLIYGYNIHFVRHWFDGMATISTLFRHWFDGMATISTLFNIGLMVWLQYPLC